MALDEPSNDIEIHTVNEIQIMIGDEILPFTDGQLLDFVDDERGQGFSLGPVDGDDNCGCGH